MLLLPARSAGRKTLLLAGILRSLVRRPHWAQPRVTASPSAASEAVAAASRGLASVPALLAGPPVASAAAAAILCSLLQAFSPLPLSASVLLQEPLASPLPSINAAMAPSQEALPTNPPASASASPVRRGPLLDYAMLGVKPAAIPPKPTLSDKAALLAYAQLA